MPVVLLCFLISGFCATGRLHHCLLYGQFFARARVFEECLRSKTAEIVIPPTVTNFDEFTLLVERPPALTMKQNGY